MPEGFSATDTSSPQRHRVVDDAPLLLGEQLDELALGLDEVGDVHVLRTQVGDNLVLLGAWGHWNWYLPKLIKI